MSTVRLDELLARYTDQLIDPSLEVVGIQQDSRDIRPGDLYIAISDGDVVPNEYITSAFAKGAVAVLVDAVLELDVQPNVFPLVDLAQKAGLIAAQYYGQPSASMILVGFTGTNGKTSCAYLFTQLMTALKLKSAYIGTLGAGLLDELTLTGFTTPPATVLQRGLYQLYSREVRLTAVEVSSHALSQHRTSGVQFDVAVFTNLSRDHLDYHETMEAYAEAKASLFNSPWLRKAVINIDDAFGRKLALSCEKRLDVLRVSVGDEQADLYFSDIKIMPDFTEATVIYQGLSQVIRTALVGHFNLSNLLLVIGAAIANGETLSAIAPYINSLSPPAGRMQRVAKGLPLVIVDYAHSPDALKKVCATLSMQLEGRLIVVFGCGGDRDIGKRPLMGAAAAEYADITVLTSDNPRSEDPEEIIEQVLQGVPMGSVIVVEVDRQEAIAKAIAQADKQDIVLIAGKGHEQHQEVNGQRYIFDDVHTAQKYLTAGAA